MTSTPERLFVDLDRSGPIPLYYQIAQRLHEAIVSGELPPGSRIENELKLAEQLAISRPTVRRAIQELVNDGLLVRRRGVGTQVVGAPLRRGVELTSLYDDLTESRRVPSTRVLTLETVAPPDDARDALGLPEGARALHLRRLRFADGVPFALLENYLPEEFADLQRDDLESRGLYQLMRTRGTMMRVARQTIGARQSTEEESRLFDQPAGQAVLTMSRTLFDQSGRPVEFGTHSYRPDMYSFEVTLVEK